MNSTPGTCPNCGQTLSKYSPGIHTQVIWVVPPAAGAPFCPACGYGGVTVKSASASTRGFWFSLIMLTLGVTAGSLGFWEISIHNPQPSAWWGLYAFIGGLIAALVGLLLLLGKVFPIANSQKTGI